MNVPNKKLAYYDGYIAHVMDGIADANFFLYIEPEMSKQIKKRIEMAFASNVNSIQPVSDSDNLRNGDFFAWRVYAVRTRDGFERVWFIKYFSGNNSQAQVVLMDKGVELQIEKSAILNCPIEVAEIDVFGVMCPFLVDKAAEGIRNVAGLLTTCKCRWIPNTIVRERIRMPYVKGCVMIECESAEEYLFYVNLNDIAMEPFMDHDCVKLTIRNWDTIVRERIRMPYVKGCVMIECESAEEYLFYVNLNDIAMEPFMDHDCVKLTIRNWGCYAKRCHVTRGDDEGDQGLIGMSGAMDTNERDLSWSGRYRQNREGISNSAQKYISTSGKNPVSLVMECLQRNGLEAEFNCTVENMGFKYWIIIEGVMLKGLLCVSKREAKISCCRIAIDYLIQEGKIRTGCTLDESTSEKVLTDQEEDLMDLTEGSYSPTGNSLNRENISRSAQTYISESGKNPVSLVMEYMQRVGLQPLFTCTNNGLRMVFQYSLFLDGLQLTGLSCASKREAKVSCCRIVIDYLVRQGKIRARNSCEEGVQLENSIFEHMQAVLYSNFDYEYSRNSELKGSEKVIAGIFMLDAVAGECHLVSWATGNKCVQGSALCIDGRTVNDLHAEVLCRRGLLRSVIAGIFMLDAVAGECHLVSWATGNKCVQGSALCIDGRTVNDLHAEVLCRRGLLRFLYQQVEVYLRNEEKSIFRKVMGKLALRPSLSFHLFVNTAPCGDGRTFSFTSEDLASGSAHKPQFDKNKGMLRTKIECGEGTIPVSDDVPFQTMDGIFGGERLRTMSCSDKILKWNSLGIQGCLLTAFMHPIYLRSLSVGRLFHYGHLSRSVCCRLGASLKLPQHFTLNHPYLASCTAVCKDRTVSKSSILAVNWNISDETIEVLNTQTGRINRTGAISRLCKRSMYECFDSIERKIRRPHAQPSIKETYLLKKERCEGYVNARNCLFSTLEEKGYGRWLKKPDEEKMFTLEQ
ncbi:Double-stranded RNA-specific adenosine deaminase [Toxocara canis]|uniref:Double-stranded RNA-specific adenosine deaminase n=1 Tax=Toxocara canis TaxID=6265 RepID=A0A0B2VMP0_TOXCA|nr:Double-stranded RNA-specific adenosine deaminase [Toxocara canis]